MEDALCMQKNRPKKPTPAEFLGGVAFVVLVLALCQIVVNQLIRLTGVGLLNLLFYIGCMITVLVAMKRTVQGTNYALKQDMLFFSRLLGDSTTSVVEIPLDSVIGLYPVRRAENLSVSYHQVTYIDDACSPGIRYSAAFALSLVSAKCCRFLIGRQATEQSGWAVAFVEDGKNRACVFMPDEKFLAALKERLPELYGWDDRLTRDQLEGTMARSMQRAYPALYPYVKPLLDSVEMQAAMEDKARRKAVRERKKEEKKAKKAPKQEESNQKE